MELHLIGNRVECDYQAEGQTEAGTQYVCRLCGHRRVSRYPPHMLHRQCPAHLRSEVTLSAAEIDRRGSVCRAPCPHYRCENLREWCVLDERTDDGGKRCNRNAIAAFSLRILGKVGCRPECPLDKGE